jgi:hypothetical protein
MARSPLITGANLTLLDADTERLLTNPDILAIDQTATASRQVLRDGDLVIWTAGLPRSVHAVAVFNLGEQPISVDRELRTLGLPDVSYDLRNAWTGTRLPASSRVTATLDPHASVVFMLDRK